MLKKKRSEMESYEFLSSSSSEDELEKRLKPLSLQESPIFQAGARVVDNAETGEYPDKGNVSQPELSDRMKHIKSINKKNWIARKPADAEKQQQKTKHVFHQYGGLPPATATQYDDPDSKAAWAKYFRHLGRVSEAMKLELELEREQKAKHQSASQRPDLLYGVAAQEDEPYSPEYPQIGSFENFPSMASEMNANKVDTKYLPHQSALSASPSAGPQCSTPKQEEKPYSPEWVEFYRSVGKFVEADTIEAKIKANHYQPSEVQPATVHPHPKYGAEQLCTKSPNCVGKVKAAEMKANKVHSRYSDATKIEEPNLGRQHRSKNKMKTADYIQANTYVTKREEQTNQQAGAQASAVFVDEKPYSSDWVAFYRSVGKHEDAEALEAKIRASKLQEGAQTLFHRAILKEQPANELVQFHSETEDITRKQNENQLQLLQSGPSGVSHDSESSAAQSSSGGMVSRRRSSSSFILGDRLPSNQEDKITSLLMTSVNNDKESQTVSTETTTVMKKDAECQTIGTGDVIYLNLYTGSDFGYIKLEEVDGYTYFICEETMKNEGKKRKRIHIPSMIKISIL
ncbi:hypothetical protein C0J52_14157 [Blattella germanica]|nr:hypothetical protein C0J52_14157 [Blattella germanica]